MFQYYHNKLAYAVISNGQRKSLVVEKFSRIISSIIKFDNEDITTVVLSASMTNILSYS